MGVGNHARVEERSSRYLAVLAVLAVAVGASFAWLSVPQSAAGCEAPEQVRLAAAPAIAPALAEVAGRLDGCVRLNVEPAESAEVLATMTDAAARPGLWVPDSTVWVQQLRAAGVAATALSESVASSPVVLAGGPAADVPESWFATLGSGRITMRDPLAVGSAALALVASRAEGQGSGVAPEEIQARLVPVAQRYGARAAAEQGEPVDVLAGITATSQLLLPVTEQEFLVARRSNRVLTAVVPRTGTPLAAYPLVASPDAPEQTLDAGRALVELLASAEGLRALADHQFRGPDAAPLPGGVGVGDVTALPVPAAEAVLADLRMWEVLTVPSSILAVLDGSGSMDFAAGDGGTRMQLAAGAAGAALEALPGHARVGLWLFSIDQGGPGVDHRELAPLARLDADVADGLTQREALGVAIGEAVALTRGGTGLYDTALAAFRSAQAAYDPAYFNTVVLMTDGANDDPGSIGLRELLARLRDEADPARPVRIIAIGISEDADMAALAQIAGATNGSAFPARDPRDILSVISRALLAR